MNTTTLLAHIELTGKLARILTRKADAGFAWDERWENAKAKCDAIELTVVHFDVGIAQRPYRIAEYPDNIIARSGHEFVAVFLDQGEADRLALTIADAGMVVRWRLGFASVGTMTDKPQGDIGLAGTLQQAGVEWQHVYPDLPPERIELPLCEVCQFARATRRWPAALLESRPGLSSDARQVLQSVPWKELSEKDFLPSDWNIVHGRIEEKEGEEELCERCFRIRRDAPPLVQLSRWGDDTVAWLRVSVDLESARSTLGSFHRKHLTELLADLIAKSQTEKQRQTRKAALAAADRVEASYPVVVDFLSDYGDFLAAFEKTLEEVCRVENIERVDEGLWAIRIAADLNPIGRILRDCLRTSFS